MVSNASALGRNGVHDFILTALAYHVVVGVRHMLMDFGYLEETFEAGKRSANISFVITVVLSLLAGVLVW